MILAIFSFIVAAQAAEPAPVSTQETELRAADEATSSREDNEILVKGKTPARKVVVGSRIARVPRYDVSKAFIRSSTGVMGLVASGIDPYAKDTRREKIHSCESEHPALQKVDACLYQNAVNAIDLADYSLARHNLIALEANDDANEGLKYLIAQQHYRIAQLQNDDEGKLSELQNMIATEQMPLAGKLSAQRAIFAIAMKVGNKSEAISVAKDIKQSDPNDVRNIANLAALYQQNGELEKAVKTMQIAIALNDRQGTPNPESWMQLASTENVTRD